MMYYPTVTMIVWAFLTLYLAPTNSFLKDAPGFFIGAVLLWDVLFRGQLGVSLTFIEEFYARNLGNLFVSPLTLPEYIAGQLAISVLRALIGVGGACVFAYLLFRFSIFSLGLPLIAFFVNLLVFGWAIGLAMSGMILRLGLGAEELAWAAIFILAPVSGVYYPDRRAAVVAAAGRPGDSVGARVRGHARAAARRRLPLGPLPGGGRAQRRLPRARRGGFRAGRCATRAIAVRSCRWANSQSTGRQHAWKPIADRVHRSSPSLRVRAVRVPMAEPHQTRERRRRRVAAGADGRRLRRRHRSAIASCSRTRRWRSQPVAELIRNFEALVKGERARAGGDRAEARAALPAARHAGPGRHRARGDRHGAVGRARAQSRHVARAPAGRRRASRFRRMARSATTARCARRRWPKAGRSAASPA